MEDNSRSVQQLCRQILADAEAEAAKALERARRVAEDRLKTARSEAERYRTSQLKDAREKAETMRRKILSSVNLESKKILLKQKGDLIDDAIKLVQEKFRAFVGSKESENYLKNLIIDAVHALQGDHFIIELGEANPPAAIEAMLPELEARLSQEYDRTIRLKLSDRTFKNDAGVKVYTENGRMLFDNSLEAIFKRRRDDLRLFLHKELFG